MNKIQFIGMKPKHSLTREVERELEKWISRERSALMPGNAEYQVRVERQEAHSYYQCSVEVGFAACKLKSQEGGKTLHAALSNALRCMRIVSTAKKIYASHFPAKSVA